MYLTPETIIKASSLLAACGALLSALLALYKVFENNKRQNKVIQDLCDEQTVICYGLRGALQGLIEQGCDGPCKDALSMLDKHLNKNAHKPEL